MWFLVSSILAMQATDLASALDRVGRSATQQEDIRGSLKIIESALEQREHVDAWRSIRAVLDEDLSDAVRGRVFEMLLSHSRTREQHIDLSAYAEQYGRQNSNHPIVHRWLAGLDQDGTAWSFAKDRRAVGDLLLHLSKENSSRALRLLARVELPRDVTKSYALRIIEVRQDIPYVELTIQPLIADDLIPELREIVISEDELHLCAAATLAFLGDVGIRDELVRRLKAGKKRSYVKQFLWQIEVQQNRDGLLHEIAAKEGRFSTSKFWALERALHRGISNDRIRQAIFQFAAEVKQSAQLAALKKRATLLRILEDGDLADVQVKVLRGCE